MKFKRLLVFTLLIPAPVVRMAGQTAPTTPTMTVTRNHLSQLFEFTTKFGGETHQLDISNGEAPDYPKMTSQIVKSSSSDDTARWTRPRRHHLLHAIVP